MRSSSWFPRPEGPVDVVVDDAAGPTAEALFAWLTDPSAEEWVDKVGVVGARDGSAKPTTRLLAVAGLVIKTRVDEVEASPGDGTARLARLRRLAETGLWHPDKRFFLYRSGDGWLLASVCPALRSLRALPHPRARLEAFVHALAFCLRASREWGLGLDPNPSNFGTDEEHRLFYLDDETYPPLGARELGEALASRLPEEDLPATQWEAIGRSAVRGLGRWATTSESWSSFQRGLESYPLVAALERRRAALLGGVEAALRSSRAARSGPRLTCVLADVHANAPALDAVLAEAAAAGVDSYLVLGDVVGYGPHPSRCIARIAELEPAIRVRGNHDHVVGSAELDPTMNRHAREVASWTIDHLSPDERRWLLSQDVEHVGDGWMAVHGAPRDPHRFYAYVYELTFRENLALLWARGMPVCFYGHTHVPFVHRARDRDTSQNGEKLGAIDVHVEPGQSLLVNPGAVGQPRDGDPRASFLLWDRQTNRLVFRRAAYPVDETVRDLARHGLPRDLAYRLETGR